MNTWEAIVLGIVEGLTEYLPVSSTGHLIAAQRAMGIEKSTASDAYAICIQAGAILAVLSLYWPRVAQMLRGLGGIWGTADEVQREGLGLVRNLITAFLPAAVVGLLFDDWIDAHLLGLWPIVGAWVVGGIGILLAARWMRSREGIGTSLGSLTWRGALAIGLIQCLAMWPGTSRSLVTIVGGLVVGLELAAAVEFSFLLGMVTLLAATVYKAKDAGPEMMGSYGPAVMLVGTVAAWISAIIAVRWMVGYLKRNGLEIFGYYRLAIAAVVGWLLASGRLAP